MSILSTVYRSRVILFTVKKRPFHVLIRSSRLHHTNRQLLGRSHNCWSWVRIIKRRFRLTCAPISYTFLLATSVNSLPVSSFKFQGVRRTLSLFDVRSTLSFLILSHPNMHSEKKKQFSQLKGGWQGGFTIPISLSSTQKLTNQPGWPIPTQSVDQPTNVIFHSKSQIQIGQVVGLSSKSRYWK